MKNYAVIQHNYSEFLGQIEHQLEVRDIGFSYVRPFVDQSMPASAIHYDALFILGASWPMGDEEHMPWVEEELKLVERFRQAKRPIVGFGYGGLLLARAFGAEVVDEPFHNAYWTTARITDAGRGDELAEAVDGRKVLVMCNGKARLPDGVEPVLLDEQGEWLAIHPDPLIYGLLFRPELKPGMIEDMIMEAGRKSPDNISELLQTAREQWQASQETTDKIVVALVKALDLMTERRKPPVFRLNPESE